METPESGTNPGGSLCAAHGGPAKAQKRNCGPAQAVSIVAGARRHAAVAQSAAASIGSGVTAGVALDTRRLTLICCAVRSAMVAEPCSRSHPLSAQREFHSRRTARRNRSSYETGEQHGQRSSVEGADPCALSAKGRRSRTHERRETPSGARSGGRQPTDGHERRRNARG